jgi:D-xylose reductase
MEEHVLETQLRGGQRFPLIGLGVGNLQHELIESQIMKAMDLQYRLIDTAHASHNEHIIAEAIRKGSRQGLRITPNLEMHVVTKVWYTYLGYDRTMIAVREILEVLNVPNIKIHILLHWPRCRTDISWMDCEGEEASLPQAVKDAGPPPHHFKDDAFKDSWRALEDVFLGNVVLGENLPQVHSIGVSNFDLEDFQALEKSARIMPHILQHNVWVMHYDPYLMTYINDHDIHFQPYNVMNGIISRSQKYPNVMEALDGLTHHIVESDEHLDLTHSQVLLKWITQQNCSVIPRTSNPNHLLEMSPEKIAAIRDLSHHELRNVYDIVGHVLAGQDFPDPAEIQFVNKLGSILHFFWWNEEENEEVPVKVLAPGESWDTLTETGHRFVVYNEERTHSREFDIQVHEGHHEVIDVDELHEL